METNIIISYHSSAQFAEQAVENSLIEYQQLEMLTAGSESLAITVVTMVPLTALGATMPRYTDWLNTGEKSFMSWREIEYKQHDVRILNMQSLKRYKFFIKTMIMSTLCFL